MKSSSDKPSAKPSHLSREQELRYELAVNPQNTQCVLNLADYLGATKGSEAKALYRKILKTDPNNIPALQGLADAIVGEGSEEEACQLYNRILKMDPQNLEALNSLAEVFEDKGWGGEEEGMGFVSKST